MMGPHIRMRLLPLLFSLVFVCFPLSSSAQDSGQRAFLDVTLNGVPKGDTLVVLRDGDVLVAVRTLRDGGLQGCLLYTSPSPRD